MDKILDVKLHHDVVAIDIYPREIDYVDRVSNYRRISVIKKTETYRVESPVRVFRAEFPVKVTSVDDALLQYLDVSRKEIGLGVVYLCNRLYSDFSLQIS